MNAVAGLGGTANISGKMSSQFLSAMLMASPLAAKPTQIKIKDELISAPYVELTMGLMKKFGPEVEVEGDMDGAPVFKIQPGVYKSPESILVEGDASSASYFLAGAANTGGTVKVRKGGDGESVFLISNFWRTFLRFDTGHRLWEQVRSGRCGVRELPRGDGRNCHMGRRRHHRHEGSRDEAPGQGEDLRFGRRAKLEQLLRAACDRDHCRFDSP